MFKYRLRQITVKNNGAVVTRSSNQRINSEVLRFLNSYENLVSETLANVSEFNYVISKIPRSKLRNIYQSTPNSLKIIAMSRHPSHTGDIMINELLPYQFNKTETYLLYFTEPFVKMWQNSNTKPERIVDCFKKLSQYAKLKTSVEFTQILIYGSTSFEFKETHIGSPNRRWKLKEL